MSEYKKINSHLTACSANYFRLKKILTGFKKNKINLRNTLNANLYNAKFLLMELSKHSSVCDLTFSNLDSKLLSSFQFQLNIYHDVELCEVNSFNGYSPSRFPFQFEQFPKSLDEKSQQNRFLTEVLDIILTSGFYEK
tara:strand:+ start:111 stop:524 length:414 start_codon:yes stop_codon:yes gene_type:complete